MDAAQSIHLILRYERRFYLALNLSIERRSGMDPEHPLRAVGN
jgi:hypothetical protein